MSWALFLDDERFPKTSNNWTIARSYSEATALIESNGCPEMISFDHDLGDRSLTGYDFAKWLVDRDITEDGEFIPKNFYFNVHSANPVGRDNILNLLRGYLSWRENNENFNE